MTQPTKLNDLAIEIIFPKCEWEAIAALDPDDHEPFVQRIIMQVRSRLSEARAVCVVGGQHHDDCMDGTLCIYPVGARCHLDRVSLTERIPP